MLMPLQRVAGKQRRSVGMVNTVPVQKRLDSHHLQIHGASSSLDCSPGQRFPKTAQVSPEEQGNVGRFTVTQVPPQLLMDIHSFPSGTSHFPGSDSSSLLHVSRFVLFKPLSGNLLDSADQKTARFGPRLLPKLFSELRHLAFYLDSTKSEKRRQQEADTTVY